MRDDAITLSAFMPLDLASVTELLRACLPLEAITIQSFTRRVLLDPNFDRNGAIVSRSMRGDVLGFMLALSRRRPLEDAPNDQDRGWITLFAVAPDVRGQGFGSQLLSAAETYLCGRGCSSVWISPYAPGYWIPGIDVAAYPEALSWLKSRGYVSAAFPLSMEVDLDADWCVPANVAAVAALLHSEGVTLSPFTQAAALPLLDFLKTEFPGDWQRTAREAMQAILAGGRPAATLWVAMSSERCVGFAQYDGERFGPIGVAGSERGRGIGVTLMYRTLAAMRDRGCTRAYFLWTNDATADRLYRPAGFHDYRRFEVLKKTLTLDTAQST